MAKNREQSISRMNRLLKVCKKCTIFYQFQFFFSIFSKKRNENDIFKITTEYLYLEIFILKSTIFLQLQFIS